MKKIFQKKPFLALIFLLISLLIVLINYIDFGFNSKYLIRKLINSSFEKRLSGDKKSFQKSLSNPTKSLNTFKILEPEKTGNYIKKFGLDLYIISETESELGINIVNYEIVSVSNDFFDSNAYVLLKIIRENRKNINEVDKKSFITYKLIKVNNQWKIDYKNNEGIVIE